MIRVSMKGSIVIVESDSPSADIDHYLLLSEWSGIIPAMRVCDINEVEADEYWNLQSEFDKIYKEKTGKTYGYFCPVM